MILPFTPMDALQSFQEIRSLILQSKEIKIASFTITVSGLNLYKKELENFLSNEGSLSVLFSQRALPEIIDWIEQLENSCLSRKKNPINIGLISDPTFHSKFYVFNLKSGDTEAIVGSSNLTSYGFQGNIETNIKITNARKFDDNYNKHFGSAEKDRAKIRKQLENCRKANEAIMDLFEQIVNTSRDAKLAKQFRILMKKIKDPNLRIEVQSIWEKYDLQANRQFKENRREKSGKKAWIRRRLIFAIEEIIKPSASTLTSAQKLEFFDKIGQYTFSKTLSLKNFAIREALEKAIKGAKWGKRQKLFGEFK